MMDQELMCPIFVYYAKDLQHQKFKAMMIFLHYKVSVLGVRHWPQYHLLQIYQ